MWSAGFLLSSVQRIRVLTPQFHWSGAAPWAQPNLRQSHQPSSGWLVEHHRALGADIFKASCIRMMIQNPGWHILKGAETGPQNCRLHFTLIIHIRSQLGPCLLTSQEQALAPGCRNRVVTAGVPVVPGRWQCHQQSCPCSCPCPRDGHPLPAARPQLGARGHRTRLHHAQFKLGTTIPRKKKKWYKCHKYVPEQQGQHYPGS